MFERSGVPGAAPPREFPLIVHLHTHDNTCLKTHTNSHTARVAKKGRVLRCFCHCRRAWHVPFFGVPLVFNKTTNHATNKRSKKRGIKGHERGVKNATRAKRRGREGKRVRIRHKGVSERKK